MSTILVLYASKHGHTGKVASRIAARLRQDGAAVDAHELASNASTEISRYDAVIVGASIHQGHHQHDVTEWVRRHAVDLNRMPSAFFSVSLTAADDTDEAQLATHGYIDDLLGDTGWKPRIATPFPGALQYREYDFMTRLLMRLLMAHGHHETDTSRDHVYTDWDEVDRFAGECAAMVPAVLTSS